MELFPQNQVSLFCLTWPKLQRPKIRNKYSHKWNCAASALIHSCFSVSDLYIPTIGLPILLQDNRWTDRGNMCINPSQIHVWGNWDWGRAVSFLRVHNSDFLCSVLAFDALNVVFNLVVNWEYADSWLRVNGQVTLPSAGPASYNRPLTSATRASPSTSTLTSSAKRSFGLALTK
jgi:hypothetical protein